MQVTVESRYDLPGDKHRTTLCVVVPAREHDAGVVRPRERAATMDIRVPEELQPILRDFTKAVLRDRPDDVLEYSKAYFVSKWEEQRMGERAPCERRA